jgi:phytoene dehydrogenase-like protein
LRRQSRPLKNIVIIGSGIGGLTTGIILQKSGYNVHIVEKNERPGGLMRSYTRHGFDCPVGIHYMGSLAPGQPLLALWDYLGVADKIPLERMGINGPIDRYIFDNFTFDLPEGIAAFEDNLRQTFPREQRQITAIMQPLKIFCDYFSRLDILLAPEKMLSPDNFISMGEYLDQTGCSPLMKSVLGVLTTLVGVPLFQCPLFFYYMILASYLLSSWRLRDDNGSQAAEIFADQFVSLGGRLTLGDMAQTIHVEDKQIKGIRLASGAAINADGVIAAIHPQTMAAMLNDSGLNPAHRERIAGLENTKGIFSVYLSLDSEAHPELPYNIYRLHPEEDGSLDRGLFFQLRKSHRPRTNVMTMMASSTIQEWEPWLNTRSGRRGSNYVEKKTEKTDEFIAEAAAIFGPLKEMAVIDAHTPLTIRDYVGSPDGSAYGIMRSSRQLLQTAFLNRLNIDGLFLSGQNIMAPGIMGTTMGSFLTARKVMGQKAFSHDILKDFS